MLIAQGIDLMSLSAHKIYGPKGIGALYIRQKPPIKLIPQLHGGSQQRGFRAGTLPTHQIVGMGEACALANKRFTEDLTYIQFLKTQLVEELQKIPGITFITPTENIIPHILNISIKGFTGHQLLQQLPEFALSLGSACDSVLMESSYVLRALNLPHEIIQGAIRISLGRYSTIEEINKLCLRVKQVVTNHE